MSKKIIMETCGGESRACPGTGCAPVLKAAVQKACKAAGLPFESLEFKPYAMWED